MERFLKRHPDDPTGVSTFPGVSKAAKTDPTADLGGGGSIRRDGSHRPTWTTAHDSLLVRTDASCAPSASIAGFDLDETLQRTKSGRPGYVVNDVGDFVFWNDAVKRRLREVHEAGFKIVVFTNQGGVKGALQGKRAAFVRKRVDAFVESVGVPMQVFAATQKDAKDPKAYRKPGVGMWTRMIAEHNGGLAPDLGSCYYVGDAAGREKDFSDSDAAFARNVGIGFHVPEDFFVDAPQKRFDPKADGGVDGEVKEVVVIDDEDAAP